MDLNPDLQPARHRTLWAPHRQALLGEDGRGPGHPRLRLPARLGATAWGSVANARSVLTTPSRALMARRGTTVHCASRAVIAGSDTPVRADGLDMVSMLRTKCRPALEATTRRPWDGRLQDEEALRDEEEGCEEVAAARWASTQLGQGPGQIRGPGLAIVRPRCHLLRRTIMTDAPGTLDSGYPLKFGATARGSVADRASVFPGRERRPKAPHSGLK